MLSNQQNRVRGSGEKMTSSNTDAYSKAKDNIYKSSYTDTVPVPEVLKSWAQTKEIQSILFKVKIQSDIQIIIREVNVKEDTVAIRVQSDTKSNLNIAMMLLSVHFNEQIKYQEQYQRLKELEECLYEAQAQTVTGRCIEIPVPRSLLGTIIGKKGENLKLIEKKTGATVIVDSEASRASISGPSIQSVQEAKECLDFVEEKLMLPDPLPVPPSARQGVAQFISFVTGDVRKQTGCITIRVVTASSPPRKTDNREREKPEDGEFVVLVGARKAVEKAVAMIMERLSEMEEERDLALKQLEEEKERHVKMPLPREFLGSIIGKKGDNIREITELTGVDIHVDSKTATANIHGPSKEAVQKAKELLDFVEEEVHLPSPLVLPEPCKQTSVELIHFINHDIKHISGLAGARYVMAALQGSVKRKSLPMGDGDHVVFLGPRTCVQKAKELLQEKLLDYEDTVEKARSRREEHAQDDVNSGKYIEVGLNTELLGVIIGKKRANLTSVMEATGTTINVDNETGWAKIKGPTAEAAQNAKDLLDYICVEIPLPSPTLPKLTMKALHHYVMNDIANVTGCVRCRVVTNVPIISPHYRSKEDSSSGEYVTFTGPRVRIAEAKEMLEERYRDIEINRKLQEIDAEKKAFPPLNGTTTSLRHTVTETDAPESVAGAEEKAEKPSKTWASITATQVRRPPAPLVQAEEEEDEEEESSDDEEDESWVRPREQQHHDSSRLRSLSPTGESEEEDEGDDDDSDDDDDDDESSEGSLEESEEEESDDEYYEEDDHIPGIPDYPLPLDLKCATKEINKIIIGLLGRVSASVSPQGEEGPAYPLYVVGVEQTRKAIALGHAGIVFVAPDEYEDPNIALMVSEARERDTPIMYALNPSLMGESIKSGRTHTVVTVCQMDTPVGLFNVLCRYSKH